MKRNANRVAIFAYMVSLFAIMGKTVANKEAAHKRKNWHGHGHGPKYGTPGAFGGPKRAGIKLLRRMARAGGSMAMRREVKA